MKNVRISWMIFIFALSAISGCTVKHIVTKIDPDKNKQKKLPAHGLVYALPRTQVIVEVPVTKVVRSPGQFARDVESYGGNPSKGVVGKENEYIEDSKKVLEAGKNRLVRNEGLLKGKIQRLNLKGLASEERAAKDKLKILKEKIMSVEEQLAEFKDKEKLAIEIEKEKLRELLFNLGIPYPEKGKDVTKKFKIGTPSVTSRAVPDPDEIYLVHIKGGWFQDRSLDLTLTDVGLLESGTSEAEDRTVDLAVKTIEVAATVAGKVIGVGAFKEREAGEPRHRNPYRKAILVAEAIEGVRNNMLKIKSSTQYADMSVETLKFQIDELKKHETALKRYFWETTVIPWKARVEYYPKDGTSPPKMFDLVVTDSDILFLVNGAGELVRKIPEEFLKDGNPANRTVDCRALKCVAVTIDQQEDSEVAGIVGEKKWPWASKRGFRYRIPGMAIIKVKEGDKVLTRTRMPVAQFGTVVALPADTGSNKSKYSIALFTKLGAMKNIKIDSTGIQPKAIEGAGAAAGAIVGAVEAASETSKLKREVELLKLKKEKKELEEALVE